MNVSINLVLLCILAFAMYDLARRPRKRSSPVELLLRHLWRAARIGAFGPPRVKSHDGKVYVVGYGQYYPVHSRTEGHRLVTRLRQETQEILESVSHPRSTSRHSTRRGPAHAA